MVLHVASSEGLGGPKKVIKKKKLCYGRVTNVLEFRPKPYLPVVTSLMSDFLSLLLRLTTNLRVGLFSASSAGPISLFLLSFLSLLSLPSSSLSSELPDESSSKFFGEKNKCLNF